MRDVVLCAVPEMFYVKYCWSVVVICGMYYTLPLHLAPHHIIPPHQFYIASFHIKHWPSLTLIPNHTTFHVTPPFLTISHISYHTSTARSTLFHFALPYFKPRHWYRPHCASRHISHCIPFYITFHITPHFRSHHILATFASHHHRHLASHHLSHLAQHHIHYHVSRRVTAHTLPHSTSHNVHIPCHTPYSASFHITQRSHSMPQPTLSFHITQRSTFHATSHSTSFHITQRSTFHATAHTLPHSTSHNVPHSMPHSTSFHITQRSHSMPHPTLSSFHITQRSTFHATSHSTSFHITQRSHSMPHPTLCLIPHRTTFHIPCHSTHTNPHYTTTFHNPIPVWETRTRYMGHSQSWKLRPKRVPLSRWNKNWTKTRKFWKLPLCFWCVCRNKGNATMGECIVISCESFFGGVKIATFSWPPFVTWLREGSCSQLFPWDRSRLNKNGFREKVGIQIIFIVCFCYCVGLLGMGAQDGHLNFTQLLSLDNSDYIRRFFYNRPRCLRQHKMSKTKIVWIETDLIFATRGRRASCLGSNSNKARRVDKVYTTTNKTTIVLNRDRTLF